MKGRLRWYGVDFADVPLRRIAEAMQAREYTRRRKSGFRLSEVRRDYLRGRFIERVEWEDVVEDPAGGEITIHRLELRQATFRLCADAPELEMLDAPRAVRPFLDVLSECAGVALTIAEVRVHPIAWLERLEATAGKMLVVALTAAGVTLSAQSSAAVRITGTEDVRQYLSQLTGKKKVDIQRLTVQLPPPYGATCELLSSGRAAILAAGDDSTVELLRNTLRDAVAIELADSARASR